MKMRVVFSYALGTALMLGACSGSDDVSDGGTGNSEANTSYISVNINNVGVAPTGRASRADYETGGGNYEDGQGIENAINKVRFYFFNADGTPYVLNTAGNGSKVNYIDKTIEKNGADHDHTAETVTNAVLVLNGESSKAPASMLAVVNPDAAGKTAGTPGDLLPTGSARFSILRTSTEGANWKDDKGFVMSNSVYKEAGTDVCSTQLGGKLYTNEADAKSNPIDVYVERVLAKVSVSVDKTNGKWQQVSGGTYDGSWRTEVGTLQLSNEDGTTNDIKIYAWIQGWGIADANGNAELCKQIKVADWTDATVGIKPWSSSDYHRCFWSNSCVVNNTNPLVNNAFSSYTQKIDGDPLYAMPNTPDAPVNNPLTGKNTLTKVLVAAKLGYQDADGNWKPAEICEYKGTEVLGISGVKTILAKENGKYYTKTPDASGNEVYQKVTADMFDFATPTASDQLKDYQVVPVLKSSITSLWRIADDNLTSAGKASYNYVEVSASAINAELAQNPVEIRKDGDTYYYTPIKHLGTAGSLGEYGVVRNHSYRITIGSMQGWGTPVYDPDRVIVPVVPSNDKSYLAARVNVLSWRVVNSKVDLDQTK